MKSVINIKVMAFSLITLMSMGTLTACSSDGDDEKDAPSGQQQQTEEPNYNNTNVPGNEEQEQEPEPELFHPVDASTKTLLEVTESHEYAPTDFGEVVGSWPMLGVAGEQLANLLKGTIRTIAATRIPCMDARFLRLVGLGANGSRQWVVKRYVFTYKSISNSTGNDTTLVGSVIFPNNTVGKPHKVDILTLYHHQAYFDNSWLPSHSVTLMGMHALNNSAVIEPVGMGASDNINKLIAETINGDLSGLQMVDCVVAALEVMSRENVTLADNGYTNNWGTSLGTTAATAFAQYMENDATPYFQQLLKLRATYIGEGPTKFSQVQGCKGYEPYLPKQRYFEGWNPRLQFYMSLCKDDEMIIYDELKTYFTKLRTMPDGTINNNVHWSDFYMPAIVKRITSSEDISKMTWGIGNHLLTSVVSLMGASAVKDPADMERILISNNFLGEE